VLSSHCAMQHRGQKRYCFDCSLLVSASSYCAVALQELQQLALAQAANKQQQQQQRQQPGMAGAAMRVQLRKMRAVRVRMTGCRPCSRTTTAGSSHTTCQTVIATVKGSEGVLMLDSLLCDRQAIEGGFP
jgi:hypothetical protein